MRPAAIEGLACFGEAVERGEEVAVGEGGVVVPGTGAFHRFHPGKEYITHEPAREGQEAGPAAGSREGSRRPQAEAAAGPAAYAVGDVVGEVRRHFGEWRGDPITEAEFEGLAVYHPDVQLTASTSRHAYVRLTAHPFPALGVGFRLLFEVPHPQWAADVMSRPFAPSWTWRFRGLGERASIRGHMVPAVRSWARWHGGPLHGAPVLSHHVQSDLSICACMRQDWVRGRDPLVDYVGMTVLWTAKVLHNQELGFYPGRQHYGPLERRARDRGDEFCGCGGPNRYATCCRAADFTRAVTELQREATATRATYYDELAREGRPRLPPESAWRAS